MKAIQADITTLDVDAIVNAANSSLLGGGGVDGAIHRAAGPDFLHECRLLGGCKTGQVKITRGYNLKARHIIHTVGPVWQDGQHGESEKLVSCYRSSLELAADHGLNSIAFPCISTGVYRFPSEQAATIAVATVREFLAIHGKPIDVTFCCFSEDDLKIYHSLLDQRIGCPACDKFPVPTALFEEVAISPERQATLYKCRICGTAIEVVAEERGHRFLSDAEKLKYYEQEN
jgi:O-acetyl-ADP-ribose deacetylase (regulator of RNase III)